MDGRTVSTAGKLFAATAPDLALGRCITRSMSVGRMRLMRECPLLATHLTRAELLPDHTVEQIMSMSAVTPRRWTRAEVDRLIDERPGYAPRYELVGGELLVTPAPSGRHPANCAATRPAAHAISR